jgi:glycosyltransferase involved in cell wall biosynthesis
VRVLWLTPELPSPGGTGGALRQWHMVHALVERGDEVVAVAPVHPDQLDAAGALRRAGVDLRAYERPPSRAAETLGLMLRRPGLVAHMVREPLLAWQVDVFWGALRPLAEAALAEGDFDAVVVCHDWAVGWVRRLAPRAARRILLAENLTWAYYENRARAARGPLRLAYRAEARRWRRHDRARFDDYDVVVAVSEVDAGLAAADTAAEVVAIPGGVDTAALLVAADPPDPRTVLCVTGPLGWPPNVEAARWLLREVWPRVRARVPAARLLLVGPGDSAEMGALADESVEVHGRVPDLAACFVRAAVVVVPILSGAGIRLKFLDALAAGRGIVATRMGAEGTVARDGEHVLLADGPDEFAAGVAELLESPERAGALGAAARRLAEERYDWGVLRAAFVRLVASRPTTDASTM